MSGGHGHLNREIGLLGLTFIGVGGIFGSGWLFAPLLAAQEAGAASIIAWPLGAAAMLLLALTYAEVSAMLPVAGGIATVPLLSHGRAFSMIVGWTAWVAYNIAAPIEVEIMLRYLDPIIPWLYATDDKDSLSIYGALVAVALLALMVVLNAFGVKFFTRLNNSITWLKIAIPVLVSGTLIATQFSTENFTSQGGFAPYGAVGVLAAISSGGVILSFLGFRHIIDLAGEVRRPKVMIPLALTFTLLICLLLYALLQIAFVGALTPDALSEGWHKLHFKNDFGPLGAIAAGLGILWLVSLLNVSAVISPFGGALIQVGGNARLALAMAYNGFLPSLFKKLSNAGIPMRAHFLNFAIGSVLFFALPFTEMATLASTVLIFSFTAGPLALATMRRQAPNLERSFKMPLGTPLSALAFYISTLIIYWSGWDTVWQLGVVLLIALPFVAYRLSLLPPDRRNWRSGAWLVPYIAGLGVMSYLGEFGNGLGILPFGWDLLAAAVLSFVTFALAFWTRLSGTGFETVLEEVQAEIREEAGDD